MKRVIATLMIAAVFLVVNTAMAQTYTYPVNGKQGFSLSEQTRGGLHVNYNLGQFSLNPIDYRSENMVEISISGMVLPNTEGCPNLPVESRLLAIPQGANARLNVINVESDIIRNVDIAPALRIQAEDEEPEINYVKNRDVYERNAFYPEQPFTIDRTSIRGVDAVAVSVSPFQYNPVTKELRVYTNIELSVSFEGGNGHFGDDRLRSPYWDPILASQLMNYDQLPVIDYAARMQQWLRDDAEGAEYLIITPNNDGWAQYANQLKDYRTRQGILTKVYRLDEMPATTTTEMKTWFHNAYNTWDIPPVAVLLFGDHNTNMSLGIPAEVTSHPSEGSCITDNFYADPTGDLLPDMVFSRLVAANATEAQMMVSKQLEYEYTNPNMDASTYDHPITALGWQTERWFQICSEVVGGYWRNQGKHPVRINAVYSGTPGSSWSSNQNTSIVVNYFGPNGQGYIPATPTELGGWTGGTGSQVINAVNAGCMLLQHRDHGYYQGWGEPDFSNNYVSQMNNVGKMTFVNTINCQTGAFNYSSNCLVEAFMRRTYNGQNAGAVGCIGPTQTSYSFVNDTYVWGLMDQYDPDFLPDYGPYADYPGNWQPAFGNVAGKYFLQQSSWPYNSNSKDITYIMFTAHCDAFLRLYTQVPQTMAVTHSSAVVAGYGAVTVSAPEGCMISLVKANTDGGWDILAVAEATGSSQVIQFEPQVPPTVINIVVTGQDYLRYEDTIDVIPAQGSYIVVDSYTPNNTPVNQQTSLSMSFRNVGLDATTGTTNVTITSQDSRLIITDGTAQFGALASNQVVTVTNGFSFIIAQNVPDNTRFTLNVTMTCGTNTWTGIATITATQAVLEYVDMIWDGSFVAGETLSVTAKFKNTGHYMATNAVAHIATTSPYITFGSSTYTVGTIQAGEQVDCVFSVNVSSSCPNNVQIPVTFTLNADGGLSAEGSEVLMNTCDIVFELRDSFGDGWNGNILNVSFSDGSPTQQLTLQSGSFASYTLAIGEGVQVTLTWTAGSWISECSFDVKYSNMVVIYHGANLSSSFEYTFNLNCSDQFDPLTITASANPQAGGTITGAGTFDPGETCTLTATPQGDYTFINWTENGTSVSSQTTYTFSVYANRTLVANFSLPLDVTVTANPTGGGTVTGGGTYIYGTSVTMTAEPEEGYVFNYWTKNGSVVSYLSSYTISVTESAEYVANFEQINGIVVGNATSTNYYLPTYYYYSLTEQIYTAEEMGGEAFNIYSVSFFNTGSYNMTRNMNVYMVNTEKTSFENSSDWIAVTDDNLVFSGNVTMSAYGWVTIGFNTPFEYDGTSNVALIVDDNSNSYNAYTPCRTFSTNMNQAICIYGSGTDYDPTNPSEYSGSLMLKKNQVVFRLPNTVTATASPVGGGTVTGTGSYGYGATCTLTATPNPGYIFIDWTEDGVSVSSDATYSFTVNGDRNLVANFVDESEACNIVFDLYDSYGDGWNGNYLVIDYGNGNTEQITLSSGSSGSYSRVVATGSLITLTWISGNYIYECSFDVRFENGVQIYHGSGLSSSFEYGFTLDCEEAYAPHVISVIVEPEEGGFVEGAGTYNAGTTITLTATANEGYIFVNWTENGTTISLEPTYSFLVSSDRELVANFGTPIAITATASPEEGGTVTGGGNYAQGHTCTLTATANDKYMFVNWTKNGSVVSWLSTYSFTVGSTAADYVANFQRVDNGIAIGDATSTSYYLPSYTYYPYNLTQQIYTADEIGMECDIASVAFFNTSTTTVPNRNFTVYLIPTNKTSFTGSYDWVTATEADRVFSGIVTIKSRDWTVFNFDAPFHYDGTSNLILVVDDNTASYGSSVYFRTYTVDDYQSMYYYTSSTDLNPLNPTNYGYYTKAKNQVLFGFSSTNYSVTVSSEPSYAGSVTGGGTFVSGQPCLVSATANEGYCFYNWTENGEVVSTDATYSFTVTGDRNLVAHFGTPVTITASANPEEGGIVSGTGSYAPGHICNLTATPNNGYTFISWTKDGEVVSYLASYTFIVEESTDYVANFAPVYSSIAIGDAFGASPYLPSNSYYNYSLSQQIYTADEMGGANEISSIAFFNAGSTKTRNFTIYMKHTQKAAFTSDSDWVPVAYSDQVYNGSVTLTQGQWTYIIFNVPFSYNGTSNLVLVVDDNTGDYSYGLSCRTFVGDGTQALQAFSDDVNYNPHNPSAYTGSMMSLKNQVIFGLSGNVFNVFASANPTAGGTVTGGGVYQGGSICTLTATPANGYHFFYWKENNVVASMANPYEFTVEANRNLVGHFEQVTNHWTVNGSGYLDNMALTGVIQIDGVEQRSDLLEVAAFCGTECRGTQLATYFEPTDRYLVWMTVFGQDGDALTFKMYDHRLGQECNLISPELVFNTNGYGTPIEPYILNFTSIVTINQPLAYGWNWWSAYVELDGVSGMNQLKDGLGDNGVSIKSQTQNTSYYPNSHSWRGTLNSLNMTQMYKIQTNVACTVELQGLLANPANHPITINNGWNWVSYPYNQSLSVNDALSGFTPEPNDQIKSRNAYATYISYGSYHYWDGTLNMLEPGQGYMYYSNSNEQKTLIYQTSRSEMLLANITPENNIFVPSDESYAENMTITAVIDLDGQELRSEEYELAAFVGDECRGSVKLMYVEPFDRYVAFLTVYGESSEEMYFVLTNGRASDLSIDHLEYVQNGAEGSLTDPKVLHFGTLGVNDSGQVVVNIYPNPSDGIFNINGEGIRKVEVMNALGQVILSKEMESDFVQVDLSNRAKGVYLLRIITNSGISTNQLIRK